MPKTTRLMPKDIVADVQAVLSRAKRGKGRERQYFTAYQILAALKAPVRARIIAERGLPGKGAGVHFAAASLVAKAAGGVPGVEIAYLDPRSIEFRIDQHLVPAGYQICRLYRLP